MRVAQLTREELLRLAKKKIFLEGNIIKVIVPEPEDQEFMDYLDTCREKDEANRKKRLEITQQFQEQNRSLEEADKENKKLMGELKIALQETEDSKKEAEKLRDEALTDLEALQRKTQFELVGHIVRIALWVIMGVGLLTTALYVYVMSKGLDSKIIESTWSNLFGILLTNSFSIVGTIMGVKYATDK
jgi:hypothetical protein